MAKEGKREHVFESMEIIDPAPYEGIILRIRSHDLSNEQNRELDIAFPTVKDALEELQPILLDLQQRLGASS